MSSSESEEEIKLKMYLEAADTSLLNDAMFREPDVNDSTELNSANKDISPPPELPTSNRFLNEEESVLQSDLNVTESMKKFIGNKLSTLIAHSIAFVEVEPIKSKPHGPEISGVKLLRGFEENLTVFCDGGDVVATNPGKRNMRRIVKDDSAVSRNEMIEQAAYDIDALSKSTVGWTNRPKSKLFEYRRAGKSKVPILLMTDEFRMARRKNNWDDSKIKAFRMNR